MSWSVELWHHFRRDLWRGRWLLLVYVVVLTVAVARATQVTGGFSGPFAPVGQVVLLCMPLIVALTVHADSALRVDAFWTVLPVRASVIVTSKLLCIVLLLVLWAVAVGGVMSQWQMLTAAALADIGLVDTGAALALLLLGTALVTAGCTSLAGVGGVLGLAMAMSVVIVFSGSGFTWGFTTMEWWAVAVPLTVGAVVLLTQRYRVRASSRPSRGVTLAAGVAVVLFPTLTLDSRAPEPPASMAPGASSAAVLRVPFRGQPACTPDRLKLPLEVTSPSTWRVELMRPRLDVVLDDGSHVELSRETWMQAAGLMGPMLPPTGAHPGSDSAATRVFRTEIWFDLTPKLSTRICGHVASVSLQMLTHVAMPREVMRVPLASSAPVTVSGHQVRIASADVADTTVAIRVQHSMLTSNIDRSGTRLGELDFALVDPRRSRLVRLTTDESAATVRFTTGGGSDDTEPRTDPWGSGGVQLDRNLLPGLMVMTRRLQLEADRHDDEPARDPGTMRDGAVLMVIAPDWFPYEVRTVRSSVVPMSTAATAASSR